MTAPALALRTAETVPGVARLMAIVNDIETLRAEHQKIAANVVDDVHFMDVPIIRVRHLTETFRREMDEAPQVGMVFHVNAFESEVTARTDMWVHPASHCSPRSSRVDDCHQPVGARIKRKYTRVGRRYWNTNLGAHVLVGMPQGDDTRYLLAPLTGAIS